MESFRLHLHWRCVNSIDVRNRLVYENSSCILGESWNACWIFSRSSSRLLQLFNIRCNAPIQHSNSRICERRFRISTNDSLLKIRSNHCYWFNRWWWNVRSAKMWKTFVNIFADIGSAFKGEGSQEYMEGKGWYEWPLKHIPIFMLITFVSMILIFTVGGFSV